MPIELGRWRLRPSGAHCDRNLAVKVQRCPLRSELSEEEEEKEEKKEESTAIIKSNNPHLEGRKNKGRSPARRRAFLT